MKTVTRKIGQNRGKPRLWIEGKVLLEAGFFHGSRWTLDNSFPNGIVILADIKGKRKVAGTPERPIIDIMGKSLGALQNADIVEINYHPLGHALTIIFADQTQGLAA